MLRGLPLVRLHPASVAEPGGTSTAPALVRDRLSPTREGKLRRRVCLYPHLEQGGTLRWTEAMAVGATSFSLTDGS